MRVIGVDCECKEEGTWAHSGDGGSAAISIDGPVDLGPSPLHSLTSLVHALIGLDGEGEVENIGRVREIGLHGLGQFHLGQV